MDKNLVEKFFSDNMKFLADIVETIDEIKQHAPKVRHFAETFCEKGVNALTVYTGPTAFNVLTHGDFHGRNVIVTRKDCGEIEEYILVRLGFSKHYHNN
jgi:Ecdysteroid kinase-like family